MRCRLGSQLGVASVRLVDERPKTLLSRPKTAVVARVHGLQRSNPADGAEQGRPVLCTDARGGANSARLMGVLSRALSEAHGGQPMACEAGPRGATLIAPRSPGGPTPGVGVKPAAAPSRAPSGAAALGAAFKPAALAGAGARPAAAPVAER